MDSENYFRLVMTNPIRGDVIYKTKDIQKAGKKAFSYISKKFKLNKSIITLLDLDTDKEYKFIAMKPPYINKLKQYGGAPGNKEFMEKIKNITKNIDESLGTLDEAIQEKQEKDDSNNIILIAKDGLTKIDEVNKTLKEISEKIDGIKVASLKEEQNLDSESEKSVEKLQKQQEQQNELEKKKENVESKDLDSKDNLLQPLIPPFEGENLCTIM